MEGCLCLVRMCYERVFARFEGSLVGVVLLSLALS